MKRVFSLNGREIELIDCTAIAVSAGDSVRQDAVLVRDLSAVPGDADCIVFGQHVSVLSDCESDLADILSEEAASFDDEDLATVLVCGQPISDFIWGEI